MLGFLKFESFLDLDLQTGTKAIAYSGLLGSWFVMVLGLATLQIYQEFLDTVLMSLVIYGFVLDLCHAGSCVLALKAVRERSDYKLIPWLVISFVTSVSMVAAGVSLVVVWIERYYFFAAACLLMTLVITWISMYVWIAVFSLYTDFRYLRKTFPFRVTPRVLNVDPESPSVVSEAIDATPNTSSVPVMVDYNTMRFQRSSSAPSFVLEPNPDEPIHEMLI